MVKQIKSLSDPIRLEVVRMVLEKPTYIEEFLAKFKVIPSVLSFHLQILKQNFIILPKKDGKRVLYSINPQVRLKGPIKGLVFDQFKIVFRGEK